jgi:serine/threonine protein kinase
MKGKKGHYIADMTQSQLVDYSVTADDLRFARGYPEAEGELEALKEYLKTVGPPTDSLDITKYIAKGTAGWVFIAEWKATKQRVAMKLIRMTQVRTGLREWYISKILKKAGLPNIVFTAEDLFVIPKDESPQVIAEQLTNAGPVGYYVCLCQDFMSDGTLEGLVEKGLSAEMMFKALEDVAQTLADMHANDVQHRDVKPENVLVEMKDGEIVAAKLCDFGSAELGDNEKGRADDVRRFGITVFALATGEMWTKNRLIREEHKNLIHRLEMMVLTCEIPAMQQLPALLRSIFNDKPTMADIADSIRRLRAMVHNSN